MFQCSLPVVVLGCVMLPSLTARGAPIVPDPGVPSYECHRRSGPILVDGKLDEEAWHKAPVTSEFVYPWPAQTGPRQRTVTRLLWDERCLYVGYECADTDAFAIHTRRDDPTYKDDCVEIFIAPRPDKSPMYYGFEMNCRGVLYDYFFAFPEFLLNGLDTVGTRLKTGIAGTLNDNTDTDQGWTLELAIPMNNFADLTGKRCPAPGDTWHINLNRWDGRGDQRALSQWSPSGLPDPNPHRPEGFGVLVFREP